MNIFGLIFSILAIISGILWVIFFGVPSVSPENGITITQTSYLVYNIALSLVAGILGIKYSLRETKKYPVKIFIIACGIILIITGRMICGALLIMAGGSLICGTIFNLKKKKSLKEN